MGHVKLCFDVLTGAIMPGQLGPTSLVFDCVFKISVIRTMSINLRIEVQTAS